VPNYFTTLYGGNVVKETQCLCESSAVKKNSPIADIEDNKL